MSPNISTEELTHYGALHAEEARLAEAALNQEAEDVGLGLDELDPVDRVWAVVIFGLIGGLWLSVIVQFVELVRPHLETVSR